MQKAKCGYRLSLLYQAQKFGTGFRDIFVPEPLKQIWGSRLYLFASLFLEYMNK
jgi:hypothetical protein